MFEVCDFTTSLGQVILLGECKSDLAAGTLSVILKAKTPKLPETKKWLLLEELKMF